MKKQLGRIGIKNWLELYKPTVDIKTLFDGLDIDYNFTTIEIYDVNYITDAFNELLKTLSNYNFKEIQVHLKTIPHPELLNLLYNKNITLWIEVDIESVESVKNGLLFYPEIGIVNKLVYNIKVPEVSEEYKNRIEKLKFEYNEVYMVDESLYSEVLNPSNNYKLRNSMIKDNQNNSKFGIPTKYCIQENYFVIDLQNTNKPFSSCIDLDNSFSTIEEVRAFQNKDIPCNDCNYYCNSLVYVFEERLKVKVAEHINNYNGNKLC